MYPARPVLLLFRPFARSLNTVNMWNIDFIFSQDFWAFQVHETKFYTSKKPKTLVVQQVEGFCHTSTLAREKGGVKNVTNLRTPCSLTTSSPPRCAWSRVRRQQAIPFRARAAHQSATTGTAPTITREFQFIDRQTDISPQRFPNRNLQFAAKENNGNTRILLPRLKIRGLWSIFLEEWVTQK